MKACAECGQEEGQLYRHHDDYGKPQETRLLCASCHRRWHWHNEALGTPPYRKRLRGRRRCRFVSVYVNDAECDLIREAARQAGHKAVGRFVREAALHWARTVLAGHAPDKAA